MSFFRRLRNLPKVKSVDFNSRKWNISAPKLMKLFEIYAEIHPKRTLLTRFEDAFYHNEILKRPCKYRSRSSIRS